MPMSRWRSPYCEDQSETKPVLLPVAVEQSVISATSTSIITVATFRFKIMAETRKSFNTEPLCFSQVLLEKKVTDTCCPSNGSGAITVHSETNCTQHLLTAEIPYFFVGLL